MLDVSTQSARGLLEVIEEVGVNRTFQEMGRRLLKLGEELGEANQAYLALTGTTNYKSITPSDLREELVDVVLVGIDAMLHRLPGEEHLSKDAFHALLASEFARKIEKWQRVRQPSTANVQSAVARAREPEKAIQ